VVILIGGDSHTGKTLLSQKLMEKYKIPYLSIDHLKMGIYRANSECGFTPESEDEIITEKLWQIIKGIIMTNIENNQNIIIEGVNLPFSINDLGTEYTSKIIFFKICFSEKYIKEHLNDKIIKHENIIENRGKYGFNFHIENFIKDNELTKTMCEKNNIKYFILENDYESEIENVYTWINEEVDKLNKD